MFSTPPLTEADFSPPLADDTTLIWGKEEPRESVEVDQRALIDKILARYSTKFPVLRELLQNADDAEAEHAFIRFESKSFVNGRGDGQALDLDVPIQRWTIHNDGKTFSPDDWDRLKTIADGNPDEHKIGAFGVGFYSVFSITDSPTVKSGGKRMRFHWGGKSNKQLFVSRSRLSSTSSTASKWTTFELPVQTPTQMPGSIAEIRHFLQASLPFMVNLQVVTVALDSHTLLRLSKKAQLRTPINLLDALNPEIHGGLMKVVKLARTIITIEANDYTYSAPRSNGIPTSPDPPTISSSLMTMQLLGAKVVMALDAEVKKGLKKVTKKEVLSTCHFQMVYAANAEQKENGDPMSARSSNLIQGGDAYVYIGHATTQTTGFAGQIAAPFIPTVERELIDFENAHVKEWNEGLLGVGGYVARTIYEYEMQLSQEEQVDSDIHPLRFFAFHDSTPHDRVSKIMTESFFTCSKYSLSIFSSLGLRPAAEVRDYDPDCSFFEKNVPMLTPQVVQEAPEMIGLLKERGVVKSASLDDLKLELSDNRAFTESEMISCLQWVLKTETVNGDNAESFLRIARFQHTLSSRKVELQQIRTILIPGSPEFPHFIPPGDYLPDHTLPYEVSKELQEDQLEQLIQLFGWKKLTVIEWLENLTSLLSPAKPGSITGLKFAELCFDVLALAWLDLEEVDKERIKDLLKDLECIPTQKGMKRPKEAYLWGCSFLGLPTVTIAERSVVRIIFEFLDLTRNVEFFTLLDAACKNEKNVEALRYLLDNFDYYRKEYDEEEANRELILGKAFIPAVNMLRKRKMVTVSDVFREISCQKMGFWIVDERFRRDIGKLGIPNHPQPSQLINHLKAEPPSSTSAAIQYFDYLYSRKNDFTEEDLIELSSLPFVPVDTESGTPRMISPKNCYLGIPRSDLYQKLFEYVHFTDSGNNFLERCKAKQEPTTDDIARTLAANPTKFFESAGGRAGLAEYMRELNGLAQNRKEISKETLEELKKAPAFIGFPYKCFEVAYSKSGTDSDRETLELASPLLCADKIIIVDDSRNYTVFQSVPELFHAPKILEAFYQELGSPRLSFLIEETYDPGDSNELLNTWRSRETRDLVIQRLNLFIPMFENPEHKARFNWLCEEGNFVVKVFDKLSVTKVLKFGSIEEEKTCDAAAGYWADEGVIELLLANDSLDYFEIACCISKVFYEAPSTHIYLLLLTMLSSSLSSLRQRGYNVDAEAFKSASPAGPLYSMNFSSLSLTDGEKSPSLKGSDGPKPSLAIFTSVLKDIGAPRTTPKVTWEHVEKALEDTLKEAPGFQSSAAISMRKEKANKYCGGSEYRGNLHYIKKCGPFLVYAGKDMTVKDIKDKKSCIECFVGKVVDPLQGIFRCTPEIIRVLYDRNCQDLAALNRNGEIYLNLAHFEKEYYKDETVTNHAAALVFWYFTLAHEITHNFVPAHNALFEVIYSRICQKYALQLFKLDPLRQAINDESRLRL